MINIDDVKTIKLAHGQVLVVQVDCLLSKDQVEHIRSMIETAAPVLKDRLLIVSGGISFSVIDAGPVASHPVINCSDGS